jgi:hypothetical protein
MADWFIEVLRLRACLPNGVRFEEAQNFTCPQSGQPGYSGFLAA